eukprot:scaffold196394_cov65-Cyclotella_meneghiniana.AAC.1
MMLNPTTGIDLFLTMVIIEPHFTDVNFQTTLFCFYFRFRPSAAMFHQLPASASLLLLLCFSFHASASMLQLLCFCHAPRPWILDHNILFDKIPAYEKRGMLNLRGP